MNVTAKTFHKVFADALHKGEDGLRDAVELYLWARDHLKEMHAVDPTYTQEWAISNINRFWNVNAETFLRTAVRLGGGAEPDQRKKGYDMIFRFGTYATLKADDMLGPDQMKQLIEKMPAKADPEDLIKAAVELHEKEIGSLKENGEKKARNGSAINYKAQYHSAQKRIAELEQEIKDLKSRLRWFERNAKVSVAGSSRKAVAGCR